MKTWSAGEDVFAVDLNDNFVQAGVYAADAGAANALSVTLSPAPTSYTAGMVVKVKVGFANTGSATINVNGLGAKTIKKNGSSDLTKNDLKVGDLVVLVYDGVNFQLIGQVKTQMAAGTLGVSASGTTTITCGFRPSRIAIHGMSLIGGSNTMRGGISHGVYINGSVAEIHYQYDSNGTQTGQGATSTYIFHLSGANYPDGGSYVRGVISNITDTGFDIVVTTSGTFYPGILLWEAFE